MAEKKANAPTKSTSASAPAKAEAKPAASSGATATKAAPTPAAKAQPAAAPPKTSAIKPAMVVKPVSAGDRARMVAEAAYFIAEKRGFTPGRAEQDWAEAERQVAALLSRL